jgi:Trk K+ transport system NAD-binding subunit
MYVTRPTDHAAIPSIPSISSVPSQRTGADEVTVRIPAADAEGRHFIVCGDTSLAYRLVEELSERYGADVTVIITDPTSSHLPSLERMRRVHVVESATLDAAAFRSARIGAAQAVALAGRNDVANVYAALRAQELSPGIRLVLRIHNSTLVQKIEALFENAVALSDVEIAVPTFVGASIGRFNNVSVRIGSRVAHVTTSADIGDDLPLCGLAVTGGDHPVLLPEREIDADLMLALRTGSDPDPIAPPPEMTPRRPRPSMRRLYRNIRRAFFGEGARPLISRTISVTLAFLALVVVTGIGLFWLVDGHVTPVQAAYLMLFTAVGAGNADLTLSVTAQIIQTVVTVAGVAILPLASAAIVQAGVHARIALPPGALAAPEQGHVVVVGLGRLGTRILQELHDRGVEVVAVDHVENPFGAAYVREKRIHFIVGDASRHSTLVRANVAAAAALVVLTVDDVVNLEYALRGRELRDNLRVVLRLFDGDFADRIKRVFNITTSRSVSYLAAPTFAAGMVGREVIGTIGVRRRVLLVADVPVPDGSRFAGRTVGEVNMPNEARVVAVIGADVGPGGDADWRPRPSRRLAVGDRMIVVATRTGLSRILGPSARRI